MVSYCREMKERLLDLIAGDIDPDDAARVRAHLDDCAACTLELSELDEAWRALPEAADATPPVLARERVLAYASAELARPSSVLSGIRDSMRDVAAPVLTGAAGALALITLAYLRGALARLSQPLVITLSLALAAGLALTVGGLLRARMRPATRAVLTGSLAALAGYVLLTAVLPISDTVQFCGLVLFGKLRLSLGQLCLTYLGVASLYAGIPMAIAAYVWGGSSSGRRIGVAEGLVFTLLAAPLVLLQSGFDPWVIPLGAVAGFAAGALAGGFAGRLTHSWVLGGAGG